MGKVTQFFSLYNVATNIKEAWPEWTLLPAAKLLTLKALDKASQAIGNTEFLSLTGGASTTVVSPTATAIHAGEKAAGRLATPALVAATGIDVLVNAGCANSALTQQVKQIFRWHRRCFDRRNGLSWMTESGGGQAREWMVGICRATLDYRRHTGLSFMVPSRQAIISKSSAGICAVLARGRDIYRCRFVCLCSPRPGVDWAWFRDRSALHRRGFNAAKSSDPEQSALTSSVKSNGAAHRLIGDTSPPGEVAAEQPLLPYGNH